MVDTNKAINQYKAWVGNKTYSMEYNNRFDCSLSVYQALVVGGAKAVSHNISTLNLGSWLKDNGYTMVYEGSTKGSSNAVQKGDVPVMYIGSVAQSGGANGHTGLIGDSGTFWNATATRWSDGATFVKGQAVQSPKWSEYIKITRMTGVQIWRPKNQTSTHTGGIAVDGVWGKDTWKGVQSQLIRIGHNLSKYGGVDGIGGVGTVRALQSALNAKLKLTGGNKLVQDGIMGKFTIKALQQLFGTPRDGVISKPQSQMVIKMQQAINSGRVWL